MGNEGLSDRQRNAIDELIDAFAISEKPPRKFLPYLFPRELMQSEMTAVASEEELQAAENSLYFWWWHFLKASSEYPPQDKADGPIADVYRKVGELGETFRDWWKKRGRDLFSEPEGTAVRVLYDSALDGDDAPDTAEMLIVEILMHVPQEEIREDLRIVLKQRHEGIEFDKNLLRRGTLTLYPRKRRDDKAFPNVIEVWDRAQKQTKRNWMTIGKGMRLKAKNPKALSTRVREYHKQAERLMHYAVRGEFPREYDSQDGDS